MPTEMRSVLAYAPAFTRRLDANVDYVVGVDGGGTSTRARVATAEGDILGEGVAGPSGLMQGIDQAWYNISRAIELALAQYPEGHGLPPLKPHNTVLGLGLAGANDAALRARFLAANPGYRLHVESDAFTALLGAHGGGPGVIVIVGTGSVGQALHGDGSRTSAGGWGFPSGDEGSGAVLGLKAANLAQKVLDGMHLRCPLSDAVLRYTGSNRAALLDWCCHAGQADYARLAPLVFDCEDRDEYAAALIEESMLCIEQISTALDPAKVLPVTLLGSIGKRLANRVSSDLRPRVRVPEGDAMDGALALCFQ